MKITINTAAYNDRRYGRPWIARVDFATTPAGQFLWGSWIGQAGEAGELVVECSPGDVIAWGKRDTRNPKYSAPTYGYIDAAGELMTCDSKIEAVRAARNVTTINAAA